MPEKKVETSNICEMAAEHPDGIKARITPEQIDEVIGGWANLYLARTLESKEGELTVHTKDAVASEAVPRERILTEIQNCAGIDADRCELVLRVVKHCLRDELRRIEAFREGDEFRWAPLGMFSVNNLDESLYKMTYIDPGAGTRAFNNGKPDGEGELLATLIHISDLHFSSKLTTEEGRFKRMLALVPYVRGIYGHSYQAVHALAIAINDILRNRSQKATPTCVVFTGDLTASGEPSEFDVGNTYMHKAHVRGGYEVGLNLGDACSELGRNAASMQGLFLIPGNHDIWQRNDPEKLAEYEGSFPSKYSAQCVIHARGCTIKLYGLDSTRNKKLRHRLALGRVTEPQLSSLTRRLTGYDAGLRVRHDVEDALNIVCLHHPLCDPQGETELDDARKLGERFRNENVDLVLAGHVHRRFVVDRDAVSSPKPPQVISGTPSQQWEKERNFTVLDFRNDSGTHTIQVRATPYDYDRNEKEFVRNDSSAKTLRLADRHPRVLAYASDLPIGIDKDDGWT